jgi:hypothetical protein
MEKTCILPHREPKTPAQGLNICPGHRRWLSETLADIVETTALLPLFVEPGSSVDDGRQVKSKRIDPPAPIRLDIVSLSDRRTIHRYDGDTYPVLAVLESWARMIREERELTAPTVAANIVSEATLIIGHLDWVGAQPWVDDLATELRYVKTSLHSAIGDHAPRSVGPCPIVDPEHGPCTGRLYQDRYGRLSVTCNRCGEVWGETELRRLGLVIGAAGC